MEEAELVEALKAPCDVVGEGQALPLCRAGLPDAAGQEREQCGCGVQRPCMGGLSFSFSIGGLFIKTAPLYRLSSVKLIIAEKNGFGEAVFS